MMDRIRTCLTVCALVALIGPSGIDAQFRRGRGTGEAAGPWAPVSIGVHGGYDSASRAELLGAHAHLPILRSGRFEIMPSAEVTFLRGAKEYQYSADLLYVMGGRRGGAYVGGGIGSRRSLIDSTPTNPGAETFLTYDVTAGIRSGTGGVVQTSLQFRWIFLQDVLADYRPVSFGLGISFPLWGRTASGS